MSVFAALDLAPPAPARPAVKRMRAGAGSGEAEAIRRGAVRFLLDRGVAAIPEFVLPTGRRADLAGLGPKGEVIIVEVKSGPADFRADKKWPDYLAYCDRFYFAVSERFPIDLLPEGPGLLIADAFGAGLKRESPEAPLKPARRKALTLRFARAAAERAMRI